jgi:hypothetical protein
VCANRHGERSRRGPSWTGALRIVPLAIAALLSCASPAAAARQDPAAPRLVWRGGDAWYVAMRDSGALVPGTIVRVLEHGKEQASGEVTRVLDGRLASVRWTNGVIRERAKPERLEVRLEPPVVRPLPRLRVGVPASERPGPVQCEATIRATGLPCTYFAVMPITGDGIPLVRSGAPCPAPWPDTLVLRSFIDRADEEIALERGEIDVAVFWPGEPSSRLRERPGLLLAGTCSRGVVVAIGVPADTAIAPALRSEAAAMNAELFRGDLRPWGAANGAGTPPAIAASLPRIEADSGLTSHAAIERWFARRRGSAAAAAHTMLMACLDAPTAPSDSTRAAWSAKGFVPLLALRCPVACTAASVEIVRALGADAFADMLGCSSEGGGR